MYSRTWTLLKNSANTVADFISGRNIATIFAFSAVIVGGSFVVFTPPFQGWDETEHFYRAYQVSEANIRADRLIAPNVSELKGSEGLGYGGYLPKNIIDAVHDLRFNHDGKGAYVFSDIAKPSNNMTDYSVKEPIRFDNTAIYSPAGYIPQAITIALSRTLETSPIVMFYIARLTGLLVWIAIIYGAIRLLPRGKKIYLLLALNPVAIFVAATLSPDAYAAASIALAVALVMRLRHVSVTKNHVRIYVGILLTAIFMTVMIKNVYLPVVLLLFLLPRSIFGLPYKIISMLAIVAASLFWNVSIAHMTQTIPSYFTITDHINAKDQLRFIFDHPLKFIAILFWNIFGTNSILFNSTFNGTLVENKLPFWTIATWGTGFLYVVLSQAKNSAIKTYDRLSMALPLVVGILVTGLIVSSMYVGWTPVGSIDIIGVQGRYFIPISFLLVPLLTCASFRLLKSSKITDSIIFSLMLAALLAIIVSIVARYNIGISGA